MSWIKRTCLNTLFHTSGWMFLDWFSPGSSMYVQFDTSQSLISSAILFFLQNDESSNRSSNDIRCSSSEFFSLVSRSHELKPSAIVVARFPHFTIEISKSNVYILTVCSQAFPAHATFFQLLHCPSSTISRNFIALLWNPDGFIILSTPQSFLSFLLSVVCLSSDIHYVLVTLTSWFVKRIKN